MIKATNYRVLADTQGMKTLGSGLWRFPGTRDGTIEGEYKKGRSQNSLYEFKLLLIK